MHVQNSALVPPAHGARAVHAMKHAQLSPGLAKTAPAQSHQRPTGLPEPTLPPTPGPSASATRPPQPASTSPPTELPAEQQLTLDGLLKSFGQKGDSPYDLNADGVVNVLDLVRFLMEGGGPMPVPPEQPDPTVLTAPEPAPLPGPVVATQPRPGDALEDSPPPEGDQETDTSLTLKGLLKSWGQTDSPYDLNADGIVNVLDLVEFLMDYSRPDDSEPEDEDTSRDSVAGRGRDAPASLAQERHRLAQVADSLLGGLTKAGFDEHPPPGIHDMVDALRLSGRQKHVVMSHLDAHYHNGLGMNLVG